eukprot:1054772-Prymnesium_polylepis.2
MVRRLSDRWSAVCVCVIYCSIGDRRAGGGRCSAGAHVRVRGMWGERERRERQLSRGRAFGFVRCDIYSR